MPAGPIRMQKLSFTKMNGAGNDFVLLDNRADALALDRHAIARLCDRHRGVGADGVLLVENPVPGTAAEFRMRYYNADGGEVTSSGVAVPPILGPLLDGQNGTAVIHDTDRGRCRG